MKDFTLSIIQMRCGADIEQNLSKTEKMIETAAQSGAQVVCLQELFSSTYFPQEIHPDVFELAETIPGNTTGVCQKIAKENEIVLIVPLFEKSMEGVYFNTAVVIDQYGKILGKYRKNHIPEEPYYHEKYYFKPGNLNYPVFDTEFAKIGVGICWDQWFPETGRILALGGAEIIFFPTAIGRSYHGSEAWTTERMRNEWILVNRAQASMNKVFLAAVNRVGKEKEMEFFGNSIICNPIGEIIAQADAEEGIYSAWIESSLFSEARKLWPFFRDRREDTYKRVFGV